MNGNHEGSKPKEKRLEEKERLDAEAERSLAVARMKQIHKQIEDIEKERKRAAVFSLCDRLMFLAKAIVTLQENIIKPDAPTTIGPEVFWADTIRSFVNMYESLRYDFQKTLVIDNEDFEKLFPEITVQLGEKLKVFSSLANLTNQLIDMRFYCNRMLR